MVSCPPLSAGPTRTRDSSPQDVRDTKPDDAALSIETGREGVVLAERTCCILAIPLGEPSPPRPGVNAWHLPQPALQGSARRVASYKNHVRRSPSSIQISNKLVVATSSCSSQTPCVSRRFATSCLLSARNSARISVALTNS